MVISKRRGSVYSKMCCLFIGLGFVLWLTEPCRFRITTNVSEHVLHEALFYKWHYFINGHLPCFRCGMSCLWKRKTVLLMCDMS